MDPRGDSRRVISMRYAHAKEARRWRAAWTDPDDAPELTDAFFERADVYEGGRLVRRGPPELEKPKRQVTLRLDAEVVEGLRATARLADPRQRRPGRMARTHPRWSRRLVRVAPRLLLAIEVAICYIAGAGPEPRRL